MKVKQIEPLSIANFPKQRYRSVSAKFEETINYSTNDKTNRQKVKVIKIEPPNKKNTSNYLDEIYSKYSSNLEKYFENNRQGMRLTGNKCFDKFPQYFYSKQRREQINEIFSKLKASNMSHVLGDDEDSRIDYFLTPLPNKSRQLIHSNKELKDFQLAERTGVVMRIYEYTRGLRSKVGINEYNQMINDRKEDTLLYLRSIVNKIGDWWKGITRKRNKQKLLGKMRKERVERIDAQLQELKYLKYKRETHKKRIEKGLNKLYATITHKMKPIYKEIIGKLQLFTIDHYKNPMVIYKGITRNINNWFNQMKISNLIPGQRFSVIMSKSKYNSSVVNNYMFIKKERQCVSLMKKQLIYLQKTIIWFLNRKRKEIILASKPMLRICCLSKVRDNKVMITKMKQLIEQKNNSKKTLALKRTFMQWIIITLQNATSKRKLDNPKLLSTKVLVCFLLTVIDNNNKWVFNRLLRRKQNYTSLHKFNTFLSTKINKSILLSLKLRASLNHLTKVVSSLNQKHLLFKQFIHWKHAALNIKTLISSIHYHLMAKHKLSFITRLSQVNKTIISKCSKRKKGEFTSDNTFKYYCYTNSTKQEHDFVYLRITVGLKILSSIVTKLSHIKISFHSIKQSKKIRDNGNNKAFDPWEIIKLNLKLSSQRIQFKTKIERLELIITNRIKSDLFHRIVLNHLMLSALNINNRDLISLLKQGKENTYQTILSQILDLNITDNEWTEGKISFSSYVQRFLEI